MKDEAQEQPVIVPGHEKESARHIVAAVKGIPTKTLWNNSSARQDIQGQKVRIEEADFSEQKTLLVEQPTISGPALTQSLQPVNTNLDARQISQVQRRSSTQPIFDAWQSSQMQVQSPVQPVRVTIGRIEVRAVMRSAPQSQDSAARKPCPILSLEDYLKQRDGNSP